ncbi:mycothiol transferase [Microbispora sp. NPDC004025]
MDGRRPRSEGGRESDGDLPHPGVAQRARRPLHVIAETHRHAGHAGIVRESIDGSAGYRAGDDVVTAGDLSWWESYREELERVAREADHDLKRASRRSPR